MLIEEEERNCIEGDDKEMSHDREGRGGAEQGRRNMCVVTDVF